VSAPAVDPRVRVAAWLEARRRVLRGPWFRLVFFGLSLACSGLFLVARLGTPAWRIAAGAGLVVSVLALVVLAVLDGRRARGESETLRRLLLPLDSSLAGRASRAQRLFESTESDPSAGSLELARLHLERVLDEVPLESLERFGRRRARSLSRLGWVGALVLLGLVLTSGFRLLEGVLVLGADARAARLPLPYLEEVEFSVELPSYLDGGPARPISGSIIIVPVGSVVTARILPRNLARTWVLDDGVQQELFVSEGSGVFVARHTVHGPMTLRVGARLGEVTIFDRTRLLVDTVVDHAPRVELADAPRTVELRHFERLELEYLASDDHGLSQIELVVESGRDVQRTELVHLDGKTRSHGGGYALEHSHPLLAHAFLPVRVRIEARDADTVSGPNWGKSSEITLLPAPLGAESRDRYRALAGFRSALVEALAAELRAGHLPLADAQLARRELRASLPGQLEALLSTFEDDGKLESSLSFLRAQAEGLASEGSSTSRLESTLLATDALLRQLSTHLATETATDTSRALDELAVHARLMLEDPERAQSHEGLADELVMLDEAANNLAALGPLGADLGSVAQADLGRAHRVHAERAYDRLARVASHLAARLRRATPSFDTAGGGGVESGKGGSPSGGYSDAPPSSAPRDFDERRAEVDKLAQEHARAVGELERILEEAQRALARDLAEQPELAKAAERLREGLSGLPEVGEGPGSASSEAALGRQQGSSAADDLSAGDPGRGLEHLRAARAALERSERLAFERGSSVSSSELARARAALDEAEQSAKKAQAQGSVAAAGAGLGQRSAQERELARKAEELAQKGGDGEGKLTRAARDALGRAARHMRDAASAMDEGRADEAERAATEAQRDLERASPRSQQPSSGREMADHGDVPDENKDRGRSFRERVQRGLSRESGALAPAVARYAEELQ
jgi:hypothetical protein